MTILAIRWVVLIVVVCGSVGAGLDQAMSGVALWFAVFAGMDLHAIAQNTKGMRNEKVVSK